MITYAEAERILRARIEPNFVIVPAETIEKPFGWYFLTQSRRGSAGHDVEDAFPGDGGTIVSRETGEIFTFDSSDFTNFGGTEGFFTALEAGYRPGYYDLTITHIRDLEHTVTLLCNLGLDSALHPDNDSAVWRFLSSNTDEEIRGCFRRLPCTFRGLRITFERWQRLRKLEGAGCCQFELRRAVDGRQSRPRAGSPKLYRVESPVPPIGFAVVVLPLLGVAVFAALQKAASWANNAEDASLNAGNVAFVVGVLVFSAFIYFLALSWLTATTYEIRILDDGVIEFKRVLGTSRFRQSQILWVRVFITPPTENSGEQKQMRIVHAGRDYSLSSFPRFDEFVTYLEGQGIPVDVMHHTQR